jgi:hypothetical protein
VHFRRPNVVSCQVPYMTSWKIPPRCFKLAPALSKNSSIKRVIPERDVVPEDMNDIIPWRVEANNFLHRRRMFEGFPSKRHQHAPTTSSPHKISRSEPKTLRHYGF